MKFLLLNKHLFLIPSKSEKMFVLDLQKRMRLKSYILKLIYNLFLRIQCININYVSN